MQAKTHAIKKTGFSEVDQGLTDNITACVTK